MKYIHKISLILGLVVFFSACTGDLDVVPIDPDDQTAATLFDDPAAYEQFLAKIYAGLVNTGQQGPAGQGDIAGIDEGESSYLRMLWYHQVLTTEEAVIAWNDKTIKDFHNQIWGAGDLFIQGLYARLYYQITFANEFLRQTTSALLAERGVDAALVAEIEVYRAEARFLRALSYWHVLDHFGGNVPFVTEDDPIGAFLPESTNAADLFAYLETELTEIQSLMAAPRTNEYGRADAGGAMMVLAKLYLNAEVYIGSPRYTEALTELNKVIAAGYTLAPEYAHNFLADNDESPELIFAPAIDGLNSQSFGATTFIVHAALGGSMDASEFGVTGAWGGFRTTSALVNKFNAGDSRADFHSDGQSLEIADVGVFTDGYGVRKWKNVTKSGAAGSDATHVDIDFPMFRLADAYLMYAEAVLRGGTGGDLGTALGYVNALRERAYGDISGNIAADDMDLDFILDERARELYTEAHRRTDLIRYGRFSDSGTFVWPWKGGVAEGTTVGVFRDLFPIPSADLAANPNLAQNEGY